MKKLAVVLIVILICIIEQLSAQMYYCIEGKIIDDSTFSPISNMNILIEHSTIGTITNIDGRYILKFPKEFDSNFLIISHIGYNEVKIPLKKLIDRDSVIRIQQKIILLKEVEIIEYTAQELLEIVITKIPENYGSDPLIMTGFLRTKKLINDSLAEFAEAIIENYKSGYYLYPKRGMIRKAMSTDIPNLLKGRVSSDSSLLNELIGTGDYSYPVGAYFTDLLECYRGSFLDPGEFKMYSYSLIKIIDQDGKLTYDVSFDQKVGTKGLLHKGNAYIDPVDFAIKRIDITYSPNGYDWYKDHYGTISFTIWKMSDWKCEPPNLKVTITWCKKNENWILHSKYEDWVQNYKHPLSNEIFQYQFQQELVIMDYTRSPNRIFSFSGNKELGLNTNWEKLVGEVDETFWDNFNYLPIEEELKGAVNRMSTVPKNLK